MSNYKISVLGEVARPGMFTVGNEKINIFEALAQAGDLTIYGVRERVKLIREDAKGNKAVYNLNLNDAEIINSPYYYLQQNDIIYVEPNKVKARNSSVGQTTSLWLTSTSILISVASLLYNILK
jgi:polysaccharide export outer membrane protein